jgi:hypothetical protein
VSREGAPSKQPTTERPAGTPIWVWVVYALGILGAAITLFSILFTLGAVLLSDVAVSSNFSLRATILWGGLLLAAVVTWFVRRRQRR